MENFTLGVAEAFQVVADVARQATAMGEQVADRDFGRGIGVMQREARIDVADSRVPRQGAVTDEGSDHGRGNRLGERRQLEHSIGVDLRGAAGLPNAEAGEIEHLVAAHDGNRQAGNIAPGNCQLRQRLQRRQRRDHLLAARRLGDGGRRQKQRNEDGAERCSKHCPA